MPCAGLAVIAGGCIDGFAQRSPARREALQAELARVERELRTVRRPELREAEFVLARYEPRGEPRCKASRPPTLPHRHFVRRVLPQKTPLARAAARRQGCRRPARTTRAGPSRGDPSEPEPGDSPGSLLKRFHELTAELDGPDRLALALARPGLERGLWRDLAHRSEERIDRKLEARS